MMMIMIVMRMKTVTMMSDNINCDHIRNEHEHYCIQIFGIMIMIVTMKTMKTDGKIIMEFEKKRMTYYNQLYSLE